MKKLLSVIVSAAVLLLSAVCILAGCTQSAAPMDNPPADVQQETGSSDDTQEDAADDYAVYDGHIAFADDGGTYPAAGVMNGTAIYGTPISLPVR